MKKHNPSKFIALAMAFTLLVTPMTAFGAEGDPEPASEPTSVSTNGTGKVEGIVDEEVYCVVLPTQADNDDTFDFILDPQDLINKTGHAAYDVSSVSGNQLYFTKSDGESSELSDTSAALTVINKSSVDVNVTVEATVDALTGGSDDTAYEILLADSAEFEADDDSTSIYLGLNVDADDAVALTADDGASVTKTLAGAPDEYETKYENEAYEYVLKEDADEDAFETLEFSLTGACNTNADWTNAEVAAPSINLVWGFDKAGENTKGPKVTLSKTGLITVSDLTADQNYKAGSMSSVKLPSAIAFFKKGSGTWELKDYSASDGGSFTYQLSDGYVNAYAGDTVTVTVTLTDGSTISATTAF